MAFVRALHLRFGLGETNHNGGIDGLLLTDCCDALFGMDLRVSFDTRLSAFYFYAGSVEYCSMT